MHYELQKRFTACEEVAIISTKSKKKKKIKATQRIWGSLLSTCIFRNVHQFFFFCCHAMKVILVKIGK